MATLADSPRVVVEFDEPDYLQPGVMQLAKPPVFLLA